MLAPRDPDSNSGLMGSNGWQEVDFSQPVTIDANTTYIASYFAPNGHYSANKAYFYTTPPMGNQGDLPMKRSRSAYGSRTRAPALRGLCPNH